MGTLDKIRKFKASRPQSSGRGRIRGIFHDWTTGDNIIRLVGEFVQVQTHFISPAPKRRDRGLCQADAFKGDDRLPAIVNCMDWDISQEETMPEKTCPVCALNRLAQQVLHPNEKPTEEEKKFFEKLRSDTNPRTYLKWNILDRDDPTIIQLDDEGGEEKIPGFKIATVGMEAWGDIDGIFDQCGFDISKPEKGVDIKVTKTETPGRRTTYSAQVVLEGTSIKVGSLTEEEQKLTPHDLKQICGRVTEANAVRVALHGDLEQLLVLEGEGSEAERLLKEMEETPEKESPEKETPAEEASEEDEDGDALFSNTGSKKK